MAVRLKEGKMTVPTRWDLAKLDLGPVVIFIAGFLCGVFVPFWH
jgi:hypothetical protein